MWHVVKNGNAINILNISALSIQDMWAPTTDKSKYIVVANNNITLAEFKKRDDAVSYVEQLVHKFNIILDNATPNPTVQS